MFVLYCQSNVLCYHCTTTSIVFVELLWPITIHPCHAVHVIVKCPVLPPFAADGRSRNTLYY